MGQRVKKDFSGHVICSGDSVCSQFNGKIVEKTIRKVFPEDVGSTLYLVKIEGVNGYQQLYADEMHPQ